MNQLIKLQLRQFADSLFGIKKDKAGKKYVISFDPCQNIKEVVLSEQQFKELLSYRDKLCSISIIEMFHEKVYSVF